MKVYIAVHAGELGFIFDCKVFKSKGACKTYIRSKETKDLYEMIERDVLILENIFDTEVNTKGAK